MQEQWSYGTGLLKEGNEVEIAMQAVDGYYPATAGITLMADVVDYAPYTMQPFVGAPSLELYTDEELVEGDRRAPRRRSLSVPVAVRIRTVHRAWVAWVSAGLPVS